jgi:DNA-binding MarR family transcriptional regulator
MIIEGRDDVDLMDFYHILTRCIDQDSYALTIRQLEVFLTCYLLDEDHTVRRLSARLRVAKPAISRMLDHLVEEGLIERRPDARDRRSVIFGRTCAGQEFLQRLAKAVPLTRCAAPTAGQTGQANSGAV